jgi:hypothetical protein
VLTQRWRRTVKPYKIWRASSTASSRTTYYAITTRRPTYLRRSHTVGAQFPTGFSQVINISRPYEKKVRSHPRSQSPKSW